MKLVRFEDDATAKERKAVKRMPNYCRNSRWRTIKAIFSRSVPHAENRSPSLVRKRESGIWQRRYWEHTIRDEQDYMAHMNYVHFNPVKHGLAAHPAGWPFSSFRKCVALGMYPIDWANDETEIVEAGERLLPAPVG